MTEVTAAVRPATPLNDESHDSPGFRSLDHAAQLPPVERYRHVYEGTDRMREMGRAYLPQFPKEPDDAYFARLARAVLFNATRKTASSLTGMVYRKPLNIAKVPKAIQEHLENVDLAGRHVDRFGQDVFEDKFAGHAFILVDWSGPKASVTTAQEEASEARPYWVHVKKEQVLRTPFSNEGGRTVLQSFAYHETDTVKDGEFGEKRIERVRQFDLVNVGGGRRVRFRSWTRDVAEGADAAEWDSEQEEGQEVFLGPRMNRIPVVCDYGNRTGFMRSAPVLDDLVHLNVRHYQLDSDADTSLHATLHDVFVTSGVDSEDIVTFAMGPTTGLALPNPDQRAEFVSAPGLGLEHADRKLEAIERRMAALGLAVLVKRDRVQQTAEESGNEKFEQDSGLSRMASDHQDALEEALQLHAMWMGLGNEGGGSIEVNREFGVERMTPQMVQAVSQLVPDKLSTETLWDLLVQGNVLPDTFDPKQEKSRIEGEGSSELQAVMEALRRARMEDGGGGGADGGGGGDE